MDNVKENYNYELEIRKHRVFLLKSIGFYNQIEDFSELVQRISQQNFASPKFLNYKNGILCLPLGMDASVYSLKGIVELCEIGDLVDAFILVRKIRDNLYSDLFFLSEALNNRPNNYECDKSLLKMNQQELEEEMLKYASAVLEAEDKNENIQNINRWLNNEYSCNEKHNIRGSVFSFSNYKSCIENKNHELKECHNKYLKPLFDDLGNNLNNYVHSNGPLFFSNSAINSNNDKYLNTVKHLLSLLHVVKKVFLIDLFFIDSTLFQTDDYIDAIELGLKPVEGSQYNVIYQILEEFQLIHKENPDLYFYLKNNNRFSMKCFVDD